MSAEPKPKLSPVEYLAIEKKANYKSQYLDGEMFAMAVASRPHNRINENLSVEVGVQLKGGPCQALSRDQRVLVERTGLFTYPDLMIVCGPVETAQLDDDTITNPSVLVEVLSPSTERYDRGAKFRNYQQLTSLKEYVLVAQDEAVCERFVRQADGSWALVSFVGLNAVLEFATVPVKVALAEIYTGVEFPPVAS